MFSASMMFGDTNAMISREATKVMVLFNMGLFSGFSLIFRTGEGVLSIKILEIMKGLNPDLFDLFMDEGDKLYLRYINTQLFKEVS